MVLHHNLSRKTAETMLKKWKERDWKSKGISEEVFLSKSYSSFPAPDGSFQDPKSNLSIAFEFKPAGETKRGILTGLGQTIAYLDRYSISYFVCPEKVEGFEIGEYIKKIPIGLIIYPEGDPGKLELVFDISVEEKNLKKKSAPRDSRYWAKYLDACPHLIWLLLDTSSRLDEGGDRRKKIWRIFFDEYYFPINVRDKLDFFDSRIDYWSQGKMHPFRDTISKLKKDVESKKISKENALKIIQKKTDPDFKGDNLFNSYKKNYFPFLDHLGLWDDNGYLTEKGYELHKMGKLHGPNSKPFKEFLAKTILIEGKHMDLILDIEKSTRNKKFKNSEEARVAAYKDLEEKGLVKKNPNRSPKNNKKYFSNEFQLWAHLGLLKKDNGTYFTPNKGFNFDWSEITRITSS